MHDSGFGRRVGQAISDRTVDRVVFLDCLGSVPPDSADADEAGLPL
jgi:hypothetical protein